MSTDPKIFVCVFVGVLKDTCKAVNVTIAVEAHRITTAYDIAEAQLKFQYDNLMCLSIIQQ